MLHHKHYNLAKKSFISYFIFIISPCLLFSFVFFIVNNHYFKTQQNTLAQDTFTKQCSTFEDTLEQHENIYLQLREHTNFTRFLSGFYLSPTEQLASYRREFSDMFSYAAPALPGNDKKSIQVFMLDDSLLSMGKNLQSIDHLDDFVPDTKTKQGYWYYNEQEQAFTYRRALLSLSYNDIVGVLEVTCNLSVFLDSLSVLSTSMERPIYLLCDGMPYQLTDHTLIPLDSFPVSNITVDFDEVPLSIAMGESLSQSHLQFNTLGMTTLIGLIAIMIGSILYYQSIAKLSRRIVAFSEHISTSMEKAPETFHDDGNDEFGMLVQTFNQMTEENNQLLNQVELEKLRQHELSYKVLQAQIDPHFLYNALEGIRMMAELHDDEEVSEMLFSLSRLMRYSFSVNSSQATVEQEITLVEQYLKIQKMRLRTRLTYDISLDPDLPDVPCPRFIIQPLVENAIKYALGNSILHVSVRVKHTKNNRIQIEVENDGNNLGQERITQINDLLSKGESLSEFATGTGIGLDNINSRMRHLFPDNFTLTLASTNQNSGLCVTLSWIPS